MRKALVLTRILLLANPLLSAIASAATTGDAGAASTIADAPKPAFSMVNLSGDFDFTSNYVFRAISQSANNPAIQGDLTYTFPIGLYLTLWGSSVDFIAPNGRTATAELDSSVGWQGSIFKDNVSYNLSLERYNYPGARSADYNEFNSFFTYKILQIGISYTGNYYGYHDSGTYCNALLTFDIPPRYVLKLQDVSLQVGAGHSSVGRKAGDSYSDYIVNLNKKINDTFSLAATWTDTNGHAHQSPYDGSHIFGTVSANF